MATNKLIDRNGEKQPSAILSRFSKSFIRFGTFELFFHRQEKGLATLYLINLGLLKQLAEYCIEQIFNSIASDPPRETDIPFVEIEGAKSRKIRVRLNKFARLFKEIIRNTAEMIGMVVFIILLTIF